MQTSPDPDPDPDPRLEALGYHTTRPFRKEPQAYNYNVVRE